MNTELKNAVSAADEDARYDDKAKRLLGNRIILAHILVKTVPEFKGMHPEDVVSYIEGEPFISMVPVEPGLTNAEKDKSGQRIIGMNTENAEINEGLIRFDIVFYVRIPSTDGISQVIVNVEAQKDEPAGYHILNRAVFYVCRLVSSQKERDFVKTNYDDIKRVFSIWVCMNMDENSMDYVHLTDDKLIGSYPWKGGLDLLNIVLIGIADELPAHSNEHDDKYELHRLLSTLFSMELTASEKLGIMEKEYSIAVDDRIREDVSAMCNLSQGIKDNTLVDVIMTMYENNFTVEQIAIATKKSVEEVKAIIKKREPVLA
ncbi:MAG: hypothetical protein NC251_13810 [Lachnoclostridium sp.]|nr:hypothetical protein [Lachnospiraceae bacterium]MCM1249482.1 hypothetical protein [Lachnoclostridium sp.]MCM1536535.1 hypothetical protein [Clostridium sp.]